MHSVRAKNGTATRLSLKLHPPPALSILLKLEIVRTESELAQQGIAQPFELAQHFVLFALHRLLQFGLDAGEGGGYGRTLRRGQVGVFRHGFEVCQGVGERRGCTQVLVCRCAA